jgi:hypothetical protein
MFATRGVRRLLAGRAVPGRFTVSRNLGKGLLKL